MKRLIHSCSDMDANMQHVVESRTLHMEDMKRRPEFGGEWDSAREGERRLCEEIAYARLRFANDQADHQKRSEV